MHDVLGFFVWLGFSFPPMVLKENERAVMGFSFWLGIPNEKLHELKFPKGFID